MGRPARNRAPDEPEFRQLVAAKLDAVRRQRNITRDRVAELMETQPKTAGKWMDGKTTPSLYDLLRLSEVLDVPLTVLVDRDASVQDAANAAYARDESRLRDELVAIDVLRSTSPTDHREAQTRQDVRTAHP